MRENRRSCMACTTLLFDRLAPWRLIVHLTSLALATGTVLPGCTLESESGSLLLASECARAYLVATASTVAVVIVGVPARAITLLLTGAAAAVGLTNTVDAVRSRLALCVSSPNISTLRQPASIAALTFLKQAPQFWLSFWTLWHPRPPHCLKPAGHEAHLPLTHCLSSSHWC